MDYTATLESPDSFFRWAAIATVAAVMRDNIHLPQQMKGPLFPNLYIILLAESGGRKNAPLDLACSLLRDVGNTKIIQGRTTVQAIISTLGEAQMDPATGVTNAGGQAFICAEELASF